MTQVVITPLQKAHIDKAIALFGWKYIMLCKTGLKTGQEHLFLCLMHDGSQFVSYCVNTRTESLEFGRYYGAYSFEQACVKFLNRTQEGFEPHEILWLNDDILIAKLAQIRT